jgi:hypothetical protein
MWTIRVSRLLARRRASVVGLDFSTACSNDPPGPNRSTSPTRPADASTVDAAQRVRRSRTAFRSFGLSDVDDLDGRRPTVAQARSPRRPVRLFDPPPVLARRRGCLQLVAARS